jgi:hypothetical protein
MDQSKSHSCACSNNNNNGLKPNNHQSVMTNGRPMRLSPSLDAIALNDARYQLSNSNVLQVISPARPTSSASSDQCCVLNGLLGIARTKSRLCADDALLGSPRKQDNVIVNVNGLSPLSLSMSVTNGNGLSPRSILIANGNNLSPLPVSLSVVNDDINKLSPRSIANGNRLSPRSISMNAVSSNGELLSPHSIASSLSSSYLATMQAVSISRTNCIREFLHAEREYVKLLGNLVEVTIL